MNPFPLQGESYMNNALLLNRLYTLEEAPNERDSVRIIGGIYKDIVYQYGKVQFVPNEDKQTMTLAFDYYIAENPKNKTLEDNDAFYNVMGSILEELISIKYTAKGADMIDESEPDIIELDDEYAGEIVEK